MPKSLETRMLATLLSRGVPWRVAKETINDLFGIPEVRGENRKKNNGFATLKAEVRAVIRTLKSNRNNRIPALRPTYLEYETLIRKVLADIEEAELLMLKDPEDPEGPKKPATLHQIATLAKNRNRALLRQNLPLGPECNTSWPTWVAPATRASMVLAFEKQYALYTADKTHPGRRFVPFVTASTTKRTNALIVRHRKFIDDMRSTLADCPEGQASTPYRALHLCALRMAEMWLDKYEKNVALQTLNPAVTPVPVNWQHMLSPEMRQRIRTADANPEEPVSPEGLGSYLSAYTPDKGEETEG